MPRQTLRSQIVRFAAVGAANTAVTAVVFYLLLRLGLTAALAFTLTYIGGLVVVAVATPRLIFGRRSGRGGKAQLLGWYGVVYFVGLAVATALDRIVGAPHVAVTAGTLVVTAPLNFLGGRVILRHVPLVPGVVPLERAIVRVRGER